MGLPLGFSRAFHLPLSGGLIRSGVARTWTGTHLDTNVTGGSLACHAATLDPRIAISIVLNQRHA